VDKVSDTPKTDALLIDAKTGRTIIVGETFERLEVLCRELERELAEQKEQYRVLTDEMLVMMDERNAAEARSNLLACALRALLSKCPDCGGTGEVGTGIIQMGQPAQMPCFVCAGERQILLKECGK